MTQPSVADPAAPALPPARQLYGSFVIGLFSVTVLDLYALIVPLFAISFGAGPAEIGLLAGARSAGPALFSLHGGSLVDRLGTRRVLFGGSLATAVVALLIPALPWFWPLFFLQFASGLLTTFNWIASQALIGHLSQGDAKILGRYNFVVRAGTIAGPVAAGALWDFAGAWPTFGAIFIIAVSLHILARFAPEPDAALATSARPPLLSALPRLADYTRSLKLMLIPVIAFTIIISTLRNGMNGVQTSVYISYLQQIGYAGTMIGVLFGTAELTLALTSLAVGTVKRFGPSEWVLWGTSVICIIAVSATPFLGGVFPLLLLMQIIIGAGQGFMQPIMFSIQSRMVGKDHQGAVVGLRMTANRFSNMVTPLIAGFFVVIASLEASFVMIGALFLAAAAVVAVIMARRKDFKLIS